MGMPACTITSQTAHGGVVIVGEPTVLIGMMPASRIGDMHTCPMFDGPVPHVGGPLILGSPTVLVGNMPQSRVTDPLTCVGPPDEVVRGCETVLVGMAGGAGAAGAISGVAAMGVGVPVQVQSSSSTTSELQYDGTMRTSTTGERLPPITLTEKGWPDLPARETPNFRSVQPVTLPEGTVIGRIISSPDSAGGPYWASHIPDTEEEWRSQYAVLNEFNADGLMAIYQVPAGGLRCWMGSAARQDSGTQKLDGGGTQMFIAPGTLDSSRCGIYPSPWSARGGR